MPQGGVEGSPSIPGPVRPSAKGNGLLSISGLLSASLFYDLPHGPDKSGQFTRDSHNCDIVSLVVPEHHLRILSVKPVIRFSRYRQQRFGLIFSSLLYRGAAVSSQPVRQGRFNQNPAQIHITALG